jgi:hypothetical protein
MVHPLTASSAAMSKTSLHTPFGTLLGLLLDVLDRRV